MYEHYMHMHGIACNNYFERKKGRISATSHRQSTSPTYRLTMLSVHLGALLAITLIRRPMYMPALEVGDQRLRSFIKSLTSSLSA